MQSQILVLVNEFPVAGMWSLVPLLINRLKIKLSLLPKIWARIRLKVVLAPFGLSRTRPSLRV